ncbi:MAG: glycerate kinase [Candidatus Planktophila sp.]|nr:glycerate kinase [Candidatus Planktophila sp.]
MKSYDVNKPLKVLVLPDKFKGSLSAVEVGETISKAILEETENWDLEVIPVADGGDGSLIALLGSDFQAVSVTCQGALGKVGNRRIGIHQDHAFIELAEICGIALLGKEPLDPLRASSYGLGEALKVAVGNGAKEVTFSLGGSASIDGGFGFLCALGAKGFDSKGQEVTPDLFGLMHLDTVDFKEIEDIRRGIKVTVLVDVDNPLIGPLGAAFVYGPQKGLKEEELVSADNAMKAWMDLLRKETNFDASMIKGLGAAGGVPLALCSLFKSEIISGSEWFMHRLGLKSAIQKADLIITTEGQFDSQSMMGKITGEIIKECEDTGKDCLVIAGVIINEEPLRRRVHFISMSQLSGSLQSSLDEPKKWLRESTRVAMALSP